MKLGKPGLAYYYLSELESQLRSLLPNPYNTENPPIYDD